MALEPLRATLLPCPVTTLRRNPRTVSSWRDALSMFLIKQVNIGNLHSDTKEEE